MFAEKEPNITRLNNQDLSKKSILTSHKRSGSRVRPLSSSNPFQFKGSSTDRIEIVKTEEPETDKEKMFNDVHTEYSKIKSIMQV